MVRTIPLTISLLALVLAACSSNPGGNEATSISFTANDSERAVSAGIDTSGDLKVNAPGFNGNLKIPKLQLDAQNFDMNGAYLYPGSTINTINVHGKKGDDEAKGDRIRVSFTSPASARAVKDWMKERLIKAGFTLTDSANGLTGKTNDGKPFSLDLTDQGSSKAGGSIEMGD